LSQQELELEEILMDILLDQDFLMNKEMKSWKKLQLLYQISTEISKELSTLLIIWIKLLNKN
jgi:hypothetical protein